MKKLTKNKIFSFRLFIWGTIIICSSLGVWQIQRLNWKNKMLSSIESSLKSPAMHLSNDTLLYRKVGGWFEIFIDKTTNTPYIIKTTPRFNPENRKYISHSVLLIRPINSTEQEFFMLNIGTDLLQQAGYFDQKGNIFLEAFTFRPEKKGLFVATKNVTPDLIKETAEANNISINNKMILVKNIPNTSNIPNNHLQYAITWFIFAIIAAVYGYKFRN